MMAKGGMKDDAPEGLAVMIGLRHNPLPMKKLPKIPPSAALKKRLTRLTMTVERKAQAGAPANVVRYHGLGTYEGCVVNL